jgi:hypothetical protein
MVRAREVDLTFGCFLQNSKLQTIIFGFVLLTEALWMHRAVGVMQLVKSVRDVEHFVLSTKEYGDEE